MVFKNKTQQSVMNLLSDWNGHTLQELMENTSATSKDALMMQISNLRKKLRKRDLDVIVQEIDGFRFWRLASTKKV